MLHTDITLTDWFDSELKPVHVGVYEVDYEGLVGEAYSYWNGKCWGLAAGSIELANESWARSAAISYAIQQKRWRGILSSQDAECLL